MVLGKHGSTLHYAWCISISRTISIPKYCWQEHYKQYIHGTPQDCSWQQNQISYQDTWRRMFSTSTFWGLTHSGTAVEQ